MFGSFTERWIQIRLQSSMTTVLERKETNKQKSFQEKKGEGRRGGGEVQDWEGEEERSFSSLIKSWCQAERHSQLPWQQLLYQYFIQVDTFVKTATTKTMVSRWSKWKISGQTCCYSLWACEIFGIICLAVRTLFIDIKTESLSSFKNMVLRKW